LNNLRNILSKYNGTHTKKWFKNVLIYYIEFTFVRYTDKFTETYLPVNFTSLCRCNGCGLNPSKYLSTKFLFQIAIYIEIHTICHMFIIFYIGKLVIESPQW